MPVYDVVLLHDTVLFPWSSGLYGALLQGLVDSWLWNTVVLVAVDKVQAKQVILKSSARG